MQLRYCILAVILLLALPGSARAGTRFFSGYEAAAGAGVSNTSYHSSVLSPLRGQLGVRFWDRLAVGVSGQFNTKRYYGFGYAALYVNPFGSLSLYGRGEYGVAGKYGEGTSDTDAIAYAVGITGGTKAYKIFLEYHRLEQPGWADSAFVGFIWYQQR
jgi:hypothetical protein